MTTHQTVTCDRCKAVIPQLVNLRVATDYVRRSPTVPLVGPGTTYDLCDLCEQAFKTWFAEFPNGGGS